MLPYRVHCVFTPRTVLLLLHTTPHTVIQSDSYCAANVTHLLITHCFTSEEHCAVTVIQTLHSCHCHTLLCTLCYQCHTFLLTLCSHTLLTYYITGGVLFVTVTHSSLHPPHCAVTVTHFSWQLTLPCVVTCQIWTWNSTKGANFRCGFSPDYKCEHALTHFSS